jgi:protein TonB
LENSRTAAGTALLRERIQSRIVYPEEAVRRGQQGEVLLRIRIGAEGVPKEIRIARSSGARLLDDAARRGVVRAAPLPSAPGWVEVPVRFRLR